ncbi:MAG TPA: hypothetical protein VEJ67_06870 [Candidatus Cybelea sp.]|nr:hypothetical protein [Candidatus Cybelea sp.]
MSETGGSNVEIAHHLGEHGVLSKPQAHVILEVAEALVLAVVAIATAWSGYQAALWAGLQFERYGEANRLRIEAEGVATTANQERLYDASTVVEWLKAEAQGQKKLAELFERRLLPEFRPTFEDWKKTDPVNNPAAPAAPQFMAEFQSPKAAEAARLNREAAEVFEQGTKARQSSDAYVRLTVILATVLLLTAVSQRFQIHAVRVGLVAIAMLLLLFPLYRIFELPRLR